MGQSHSSTSRPTRANRGAAAPSQPPPNPAPASLPPPATPAPPTTTQAPSDDLLRPPDAGSSVPRTSPTRSMSQRLPKLSLRSRRRSMSTEDLSQPAQDSPSTSKRRWLRSLRSRPTSALLPASSSSRHPDLAEGSSKLAQARSSLDREPPPARAPVAGPSAAPVPSADADLVPIAAPVQASIPASSEAFDNDVSRRTFPHVEAAPHVAANPEPVAHPAVPSPPTGGGASSSLIIVQGIVQTQDAPSSSTSTPTPTSAPSTSAMPSLRPSSFLRRRRSGQASARNSLVSPSPTSVPPSATDILDGAPAPAAPSASASPDEGSTQLSQSSIDVLGTLLSFATAATAASLVTGSIDPLFHSGLAQSPEAPPAVASQGESGAQGTERDRSGRLRSALGGMRDLFRANRRRAEQAELDSPDALLGELARAINAGLAAGRAHAPPNASTSPSPATVLPTASGAPTASGSASSPAAVDPADLPLPPSPFSTEFPERAVRTASTSAGAAVSGDAPASAERTTPPVPPLPLGLGGPTQEDSFERFLHNLQADLRTALTQDYARPGPGNRAASPSESASTSSSAPSLASASSSSATDDSSIPVVLVQSPSEPDAPAAQEPAPRGSTEQPVPVEGGGPGARGNNGINWWRLYRFPPTYMPAGAVLAGSVPAPPAAASNQAPRAAAGTTQSPDTAPADASANRDPTPTTAQQQQQQGMVVPVVVVGLQSVNPIDAADILPQEVRQEAENAAAAAAVGATTAPATQRLSRAARALNRLSNVPWRSGSEASSSAAQSQSQASASPLGAAPTAAPAPGTAPPPAAATRTTTGRTYLIYVIGGYYPLDHTIVTGDLNSFEALWYVLLSSSYSFLGALVLTESLWQATRRHAGSSQAPCCYARRYREVWPRSLQGWFVIEI
ncbi:hypothetical protein EXIGLDRAFT_65332 [Exidia glandulosa HHB12029]|uniref:Uncharacterized protein n=1 Tax=Exidia glandulosa HHB12029 TaxID=1314781 RepID=A0A165P2E0_EXIGL|nr:hypothetical protein EXIGLDRAFT_65332 [Exidia glandulosa HHB12029]